MFWAATTVPLPLAAVSTLTCVGTPTVTVSVPESVVVNEPEVARMVAVPGAWAVKVALLRSPAATKSPSTTPPLLVGNDHASAATLATKLPMASRVMAYAVIEVPERFCAGTTVPLPLAAVSTLTWVALPATTVSVPESLVVSEPEVARMVAVPRAWPVKVALLLSPAGAKSPLTTPPVLTGSDHVAAMLPTKLPPASREMA